MKRESRGRRKRVGDEDGIRHEAKGDDEGDRQGESEDEGVAEGTGRCE